MRTIAERVAAGAAFLDEHEPGWADRINLRVLDQNSVCLCVLGQTFAGRVGSSYYGNGYDWALEEFDIRTAAALGFDAVNDDEDYDDLATEWARLIVARRKAPHA
jgi:hypothetical protein